MLNYEGRITKNFTLGEVCKSDIASRLNIDNTPDDEALKRIKDLCVYVLQPIRDSFKCPIKITSFYRSKKLNETIGGSAKSQHIKGEAVDFEIANRSNFTTASYIRANFDFDQLILEHYDGKSPASGWVHCSYRKERNRNQVLTAAKNPKTGEVKYFKGLILEPFKA